MKISETIKMLEQIKEEYGNLEVVGYTELEDEFIIDWNREFGVVEIPDDNEEDWFSVCALIETDDDEPHLKVIK